MNSNQMNLTVKLTFSNELTDVEKTKIVNTILNSLKFTADHEGLVPDNVEGYTETITVTNVENGKTLIYDYLKEYEKGTH